MSEVKNINPIEITALGGAETLNVNDSFNLYVLYCPAAITLNGNFTIAPLGTPVDATMFKFIIIGDITLGTGDLIVFGRTILQSEITGKCNIECYYDIDLAAWTVVVVTGNNATDIGKILSDSTDPTPDYLDGKVQKSIVIDAGTHKIELDGDVLTPGAVMLYGTDSAGVKGWYEHSEIFVKEFTVTHADIVQGNSVPLIAIDNPGAGYAIQLVGIARRNRDWTLPYAGHTTCNLYTDTASVPQAIDVYSLLSSVNKIALLNVAAAAGAIATVATDTQIIANKALYWAVDRADPDYASGDPAQSLTYYISYRIITV
jgi:hypothetical protein